MQPLPRELLYSFKEGEVACHRRTLRPKPEGTYLITRGLCALGLEVAGWLVEKDARHWLPPRGAWTYLEEGHTLKEAVDRSRLESPSKRVALSMGFTGRAVPADGMR